MKQKSLPIHPIVDNKGIVTENPNFLEGFMGLNKFEYCSILALQGMLSNPNYSFCTTDELTDYAIECAENLFEKLNKEQ
jgi:hypothetical protein